MIATMHMNLGKNGLTAGSMEMIQNAFKKHKQIRITVLKSFTRDREKIKETGNSIISNLGKNYRLRIIGFTIILNRKKQI